MSVAVRDYESIIAALPAAGRLLPADARVATMQQVVDLLWGRLESTGVSWVGFYFAAENEEMILGPRRDRPACSPIGLHGACGQSLTSKAPLVVHDVRELGEGYIACDPRDQSEVVVPLIDASGSAYAVLDLDSFDVGSFTQADAEGLVLVLRHVGLTV